MNVVSVFTLLLVSLVPGILWVWFFYRQDRYDKEPKRLIVITFLAGMVAVVPAAIFELPFRHYLTEGVHPLVQLTVAVLVVGLGEEGAKLLAAYLAAFHQRAFNEPVDGIIYAVTASLGFAAVENMFYVLTYGIEVGPTRAVVTSLAHASFGGIAGLFLGMAKLNEDLDWRHVLKGLGIAALLHGVYDFLIIARLVHPLVSIALVYLTYRYVSWKIRTLSMNPQG